MLMVIRERRNRRTARAYTRRRRFCCSSRGWQWMKENGLEKNCQMTGGLRLIILGCSHARRKNINFTEIAHNSPPHFQYHQKRATTGPIRSTFQVVKGSPLEIAESIMQSSSGAWRLGNRETSLVPTDGPGRPPKGKSISGPTYPKPPHKNSSVLRCIFIPPFPLP